MVDRPRADDRAPVPADPDQAAEQPVRLLVSPEVAATDRDRVRRLGAAPDPDADPGGDTLWAELAELARQAAEPVWAGTLVGAVVALAAVLAVMHVAYLPGEAHAPWYPAWVAVAVPPAVVPLGVLITVGMVYKSGRDHRRAARLAARWSAQVITEERQRQAARSFPEVGVRLGALYERVDQLQSTHHTVLAEGWLPGLDPDRVDALHYTLVRDLLETVPLRRTISDAQTRPALADQVAQARTRLAQRDAEFDTALRQLRQVCDAAQDIEARLRDLRLAEQLDAHTHDLTTLRADLPTALGTDLPALAATAQDSAALVRAALDSARPDPDQPPRDAARDR
jgi:hypothetical protein